MPMLKCFTICCSSSPVIEKGIRMEDRFGIFSDKDIFPKGSVFEGNELILFNSSSENRNDKDVLVFFRVVKLDLNWLLRNEVKVTEVRSFPGISEKYRRHRLVVVEKGGHFTINSNEKDECYLVTNKNGELKIEMLHRTKEEETLKQELETI